MTAPFRTVVVDDDFAVTLLHSRFIDSDHRFRTVATAHTGAAALEAVQRERPQLVLLDVYLPDIGGIDVLRQLRARTIDVEVIAVTAARDLETVRQASQLGVRHYLVKPFQSTALRERLDAVARSLAFRERGTDDLDQDAIDRLTGTSGSASPSALPKGLSAATLHLVVTALKAGAGDVSASEIAERLGMSRVSARRYLEHLAATGQATVEPRYGTAGRPENRFRLLG